MFNLRNLSRIDVYHEANFGNTLFYSKIVFDQLVIPGRSFETIGDVIEFCASLKLLLIRALIDEPEHELISLSELQDKASDKVMEINHA